MNPTVGDCHLTVSDFEVELALEHLFIGKRAVVDTVEEAEYIFGNVLSEQIVRVDILPLVIMLLRNGIEISGGQFCVCHIQRPVIGNALDSSKHELVFDVALSQVVELFGSINIVLTIEDSLFKLFFGERTVDVEVNLRLSNIHSEMGFNRFQRKSCLTVIEKVELLEINFAVPYKRMLPSDLTVNDDIIVEFLDLFRGCIRKHRFQNELVVVLIVETCEKRVVFHERLDRFVVVVDDCVFAAVEVFEHKEPIKSEYLAVETLGKGALRRILGRMRKKCMAEKLKTTHTSIWAKRWRLERASSTFRRDTKYTPKEL